MVNYQTESLDAVFSALGDATRRAILAQLAGGEASVSALAEPHAMSLPAVSKHLSVLEGAGLVRREKTGRVVRCRLTPEPLKGAVDWIEEHQRFWEEQLDALAGYLEGIEDARPPADKKEGRK